MIPILPWVLIILISVVYVLGIYVFWKGQLIREKYIQKTINEKVQELTEIISIIYERSENVHDSDAEAHLLEQYFSRQIRRITLLSLHIENQLYRLGENNDYEKDIKTVLKIALWLLEKYDDPTITNKSRFYLWKDRGSSELTDKTIVIVDIAKKLK